MGGDETVSAVVAGTRAMVNPSARKFVAAVRAGQPGIFAAQGTRPAWRPGAGGRFPPRRLWQGHAVDQRSGHTSC